MFAGLILAAGQSRRFGRDKRQVNLPNGDTLLAHTLSVYRAVCEPLYVVIGPEDAFAGTLCEQQGCRPVVNPNATKGMGTSLACGVRAIEHDDPDESVQGLIVGLADMPAVTSPVIERVQRSLQELANSEPDRPVVPSHRGRLGHPRGIPRVWFDTLRRLSGDQGARSAIPWDQAHLLEIDDPGILIDIDTPADLDQWVREKSTR
ncbi:MAG TPA: nucleotidyltransferase family protein [Aquabacterium sp.]|nr:nucleotidyltransferase family protein [Aquabacterium sp.]